MLKAIIVEDEENGRKYLETLLAEFYPRLQVVAIAENVSQGIQVIQNFKPDIVFLDIQMNTETGFDLLERIGNINFEVVFTTAYEQYALKAIKFAAVDYLLKPIDKQDLATAIEKVEKRQSSSSINKNFEILLQNIKNSNTDNHQIALATSDGLVFVKVNNIVCCESDGPYTNFFLKNNEKLMTSKNLKEYEELLSEHNFFRIHKSYLINMNEIKKYIRGDGGQVNMSNGRTLDVSKRKKESFLAQLSKV